MPLNAKFDSDDDLVIDNISGPGELIVGTEMGVMIDQSKDWTASGGSIRDPNKNTKPVSPVVGFMGIDRALSADERQAVIDKLKGLGAGSVPPLKLVDGENGVSLFMQLTRNSNATYWGADGKLHTAGPDVLRADHFPGTSTFRGYRLEQQSTNHLKHTNDLTHSSWVIAGSGNPTITDSADDWVEVTFTGGVGNVLDNAPQDPVTATDADWTYALDVQLVSGDANNWLINMRDGSGTKFSEPFTPTSQWQRFQINKTLLAGPSGVQCYIRYNSLGSPVIRVRRPQLEENPYATSFIYTGASIATRPRDNLDLVSTDPFSSWHSEGSFFIDFESAGIISGTANSILSFGGEFIAQAPAADGVNGFYLDSGVFYTIGEPIERAVFAWKGTDLAVGANGKPVQHYTVTDPYLSSLSWALPGDSWNGWIRQLRFNPTQWSDSEIISMTTVAP